jgi:hypothetical protein
MKKRYKIIIICVCVICLIAFAIFGGLVGSGNYGYAQQYEFNTTDSVLINKVKLIKDQNPDFRIPSSISLKDYLANGKFHFYIYYKNENQIVHCFIMNTLNNPNNTSIYLDAINYGLTLGNWKVVNSDYDRSDNLKVKLQFEERFLNKLKLPYQDEGNGNFVFWK